MIPPLEINAPLEVTSTPSVFSINISCVRYGFPCRMRHINPHLPKGRKKILILTLRVIVIRRRSLWSLPSSPSCTLWRLMMTLHKRRRIWMVENHPQRWYSCIDVVYRRCVGRHCLILPSLFVLLLFSWEGWFDSTVDRWFGMGRDIVIPSKPTPRLFKLITQHYHGAAEKTLNTSELVHRPSVEVY